MRAVDTHASRYKAQTKSSKLLQWEAAVHWRVGRIHLSTALAMMLVAGVLLGLNAYEQGSNEKNTILAGFNLSTVHMISEVRGWPWSWHQKSWIVEINKNWGEPPQCQYWIKWTYLAFDFLVAIALTVATGCVVEYFLRIRRG